MTDSRKNKMAIIFKQHPNVNELHFTSDDQAFYQPQDAKNHAGSLQDKEVELVKRKDILVKEVDEASKQKASKTAKAKDKKEADAKLAATSDIAGATGEAGQADTGADASGEAGAAESGADATEAK